MLIVRADPGFIQHSTFSILPTHFSNLPAARPVPHARRVPHTPLLRREAARRRQPRWRLGLISESGTGRRSGHRPRAVRRRDRPRFRCWQGRAPACYQRREECGDRGKRGQDKHQHPGSRSGIQDPLVHGPDAAERQRRIDPLERSSQARGDGRRVRPTRDEVHRTKWELSMRVIDGRLGRATERCMLHVCKQCQRS